MCDQINMGSWQENDRRHVWHPYTQAKTATHAISIKSGKGSYLYTEDGRQYFDAISSWWVNLHGHSHPHIKQRISAQMEQLEHVAFADFTHYPAAMLAKKLVEMLGWEDGRVFFSDNGSTAVETALKMAMQYWHNIALKPPKKVICFHNAFHGDTFGAMSVGGRSHFNLPFWPYLFEAAAITPPYPGKEEQTQAELQAIIREEQAACFIFEPVVQGAYGMRVHSTAGLNALVKICQEHGVITIADEVMTGFGRTGTIFACEHADITPDIICFSKGLTGGFLPLGATVCSGDIYEAFYSDKLEAAFLHGHSYCANPLACAAGLASMELLEKEECTQQRHLIEKCHQNFTSKWAGHPRLKRCEVIGTILVIEYKDPQDSYFSQFGPATKRYLLSQGIFTRPLGNILYLLPPYCTKPQDLEHAYYHIQQTLETDSWKQP